MIEPTLSAVIVPVPELEPVVREHRARFDRAAGWGVPAHVTVVVPFVAPVEVDESVLERLAAAVASVAQDAVAFDATGWFGAEVLWLAPNPATVFKALTAAVVDAFPDHQPYGGAFNLDEVVPHLTVGHNAPLTDLRPTEASLLPRLPVRAHIRETALWHGSESPSTWSQIATFPLG